MAVMFSTQWYHHWWLSELARSCFGMMVSHAARVVNLKERNIMNRTDRRCHWYSSYAAIAAVKGDLSVAAQSRRWLYFQPRSKEELFTRCLQLHRQSRRAILLPPPRSRFGRNHSCTSLYHIRHPWEFSSNVEVTLSTHEWRKEVAQSAHFMTADHVTKLPSLDCKDAWAMLLPSAAILASRWLRADDID